MFVAVYRGGPWHGQRRTVPFLDLGTWVEIPTHQLPSAAAVPWVIQTTESPSFVSEIVRGYRAEYALVAQIGRLGYYLCNVPGPEEMHEFLAHTPAGRAEREASGSDPVAFGVDHGSFAYGPAAVLVDGAPITLQDGDSVSITTTVKWT